MQVEQIGVVGAGMMGSEIAQVAAAAGRRVTVVDVDDAAIERGLAHVRGIVERRVAKGRMSRTEADAIVGRIAGGTDLAAIAGCDLVIEAAPEILELKRDLWRRLDAVARPAALLASNTSGLSISALAQETSRPDRVLGLHFFNPASVMLLVEVIRGERTSDEAMDAAVAVSHELGKTPIRVRECPGFLVNRILVRALAEAYRLAGELGADRGSADEAVVEGGPAPMGPFALGDLIGLDTTLHVQRDLEAAYGDRFAAGGSLETEVAAGRLGQKSGSGFVAGRPPGTADGHGPAVAGRYYMAALDEACRCLEEEIASLPDVDLAMRLGTGWEQGPLGWADREGLPSVARRLDELASVAGDRFAPRPVLLDRISRGATFHETTEEG